MINFLLLPTVNKHAFLYGLLAKSNFPHPPMGRSVGRKLQHTQPLSIEKF